MSHELTWRMMTLSPCMQAITIMSEYPWTIRIIPMMTIMGIIFFLSHQPGYSLPQFSIEYLDKLVHALIYAVLAMTTFWLPPSRWKKNYPILMALAVVSWGLLNGAMDEYHQSFIPGRESSTGDVVADVTGAAAISLGWCLKTVFQRR